MGRKKKVDAKPTLPFGKFKGRTLAEVMQAEPSYLAWFVESVEGCKDIKDLIYALPGFMEAQAKYYGEKCRRELTTRQIVEATVREMFAVEDVPGVEPSAEQIDDLCDRLFNAPPSDAS